MVTDMRCYGYQFVLQWVWLRPCLVTTQAIQPVPLHWRCSLPQEFSLVHLSVSS